MKSEFFNSHACFRQPTSSQVFSAPCAVKAPPKNPYEKQQERTRWDRAVEWNLSLYGFFRPVEKKHAPYNQEIGASNLHYRGGAACLLRLYCLPPEYFFGQQR
jgi:hypothetical protein